MFFTALYALLNQCAVFLEDKQYYELGNGIVMQLLATNCHRENEKGLYKEAHLRLRLYQVLRALLLVPQFTSSRPLEMSVHIFQEALRWESELDTRLFCSETVSIINSMIYPSVPVRHVDDFRPKASQDIEIAEEEEAEEAHGQEVQETAEQEDEEIQEVSSPSSAKENGSAAQELAVVPSNLEVSSKSSPLKNSPQKQQLEASPQKASTPVKPTLNGNHPEQVQADQSKSKQSNNNNKRVLEIELSSDESNGENPGNAKHVKLSESTDKHCIDQVTEILGFSLNDTTIEYSADITDMLADFDPGDSE